MSMERNLKKSTNEGKVNQTKERKGLGKDDGNSMESEVSPNRIG